MNVNELNTLKLRRLFASCLFVLAFINLNAQSITCGDIVVSLDPADCTATVTPGDVVENQGDFPGFPANFTIELFYDEAMTMPVATSPMLTSINIGQTIIVQATFDDGTTSNSCWRTIQSVSDYAIPDLECSVAPINVDCTDSTTPSTVVGAAVGFPVPAGVTVTANANGTYNLTNFDACGDATLSYADASVNGACPVGPIETITRTWTATDENNNTTSCTETIIVNRVIGPIVFPTDVTLECNNSNPPNTTPATTGYPTVNGVDITATLNGCELQAIFTDQVLSNCGGSTITNRTWNVYDCMGNLIGSQMQFVKLLDTTAPSLTCPADVTVGSNQVNCLGSAILPTVNITDGCSTFTTTTTANNGIINGNFISGLPLGATLVTVTAEDACGKSASCSYTIFVEDQSAPTPICESTHTVSLTNANPTLVPAFVFDDGSFDACGEVTFAVRRMNGSQCPGNDATPFGDFVPFFCCDLGETIMVELRVTDEANNTNSCMVEVIIQDKIDPILACPLDKILDCHQDYTDLGLTGSATATDNCASITPTFLDNGSLNNCGVGTIFRTWTADDGNGNIVSCIQRITVENSTPYFINTANDNDPNDDVIWPADISDSGCTLPSMTGEPILLNEDICSQVGFFSSDVFLPVDNGPGCQRILRTWTVFDNCQPNINGEQCNSDLIAADIAHWCYTQDIVVLNMTDPVFTDCPTSLSFDSDDVNCATGVATLTATATDDCNSLNYNYEIDLDYLNNPGVDIPWTADPDNDGSHTATYPLGTHLVTWKVEDFCGNVAMCSYPFTIRDGKAPTPNVLSSIARNLMAGLCMIEVFPTEWDNPNSPTSDNCGISQWLIRSPSLGSPQGSTPPSDAATSWVFSGAASVGPQSVDLWIQDINGNWVVVAAQVLIQDNNVPACASPPDYAIVSGGIENEEGEEVEYVMVEITGDMNEEEETGNDGVYSFDLPVENNYTVTPERDDNPLNGVSTFDLVKISQHILDVEALATPYKIIAADVNNSGSVTTLDLVELRKLILFIDTEFSNNTSWRFVDAGFVFPNPADPFQTSFPEVYTINDLNENMLANFVGVKVGDVNCSATANDFAGSSDDRNSGENLNFFLEDQSLKAGQTYTVDFDVKEVKDLQGYQFTLAFDQSALAFKSIIPGDFAGINEGNFGMNFINQGVITSSWHTTEMLNTENATGFSLMFTALKDAQLSELININSRYTKAQAYFNNEFSDVSIAFESENGIALNHFQLFQNRPNPFKGATVISFNLPENEAGTLTIYDLSGRVIEVVQGEFNQGYNEVDINSADLSGHGVFYYQLEVANHTATKKMVLLK